MTPGILQEMTIDDIRDFHPEVVLLGVASTEPHGPILPYGTDFYQCDGLCRRAVLRANELGARALLYPTLPIGNNVNFKAFPFACRISVRTLMHVVLDIIQALEEDGIRKIVLVNGHGGNTDTLRATLREHFDRTPPAGRAFVCLSERLASPEAIAAIQHPSDHGGESETSQMMHLRPDLVRADQLQNLPVGQPLLSPRAAAQILYVRPWHRHVPLGGGGETRASTPAKGQALLDSSAENLANLLLELTQSAWNPDFPYPPGEK